MLRGEPVILYSKQQKLLSAWIAMTVMTGEFSEPDNTAIPIGERQRLMDEWTLPTHWRIWIGRCANVLDQPRWHHRIMTFGKLDAQLPIGEPVPPSNTQTTTIRLGEHLIIHVMSSEVAKRIVRLWKFPPGIAPALQQISPSLNAAVSWPRKRILARGEIMLLADHFFDRANSLSIRASLPGFEW
jgi:hypothetical protein